MATTSSSYRACLLACRQTFRAPVVTLSRHSSPLRTFSSTGTQYLPRRERSERDEAFQEDIDRVVAQLNKKAYENATPKQVAQLDEYAQQNDTRNFDEFLDKVAGSQNRADVRAMEEEMLKITRGDMPDKSSLWYDEDDPQTNTDEEAFDEDDMTSMAHGKLQQIKEMRNYERLIVWEMPLLSKLAKPFQPPTEKEVLRWRYTTFMGDAHPSENKVTVQFSPDDLGLKPVQAEKLKKLAGPRYDPSTQIVKMSSESFQQPAQNKAYLSGLVDDLVAAAKDPSDTFADVPLDTRHHTIKNKPQFPKSWRMTKQRLERLEAVWQKVDAADVKRLEEGKLVDGEKHIDGYLMERLRQEQEKALEPELVEAPRRPAKGARGARPGRR